MVQRCTNPNALAYKDYGSRGIKVCDRWLKFENFYADMGDPPSRDHSVDRKDNDGDYEPGNCYWATRLEQANNKRSSRFITFQGRTLTLAQWGRETGLGSKRIFARLSRDGWTIEKALTYPASSSRRYPDGFSSQASLERRDMLMEAQEFDGQK